MHLSSEGISFVSEREEQVIIAYYELCTYETVSLSFSCKNGWKHNNFTPLRYPYICYPMPIYERENL